MMNVTNKSDYSFHFSMPNASLWGKAGCRSGAPHCSTSHKSLTLPPSGLVAFYTCYAAVTPPSPAILPVLRLLVCVVSPIMYSFLAHPHFREQCLPAASCKRNIQDVNSWDLFNLQMFSIYSFSWLVVCLGIEFYVGDWFSSEFWKHWYIDSVAFQKSKDTFPSN